MKYEFVVRPGARATDIQMKYTGADELSVGGSGTLLAKNALGSIEDRAPISFAVRSYQPGIAAASGAISVLAKLFTEARNRSAVWPKLNWKDVIIAYSLLAPDFTPPNF